MKLFESISYQNGNFQNLDLHQKRMNNSRKKLFSSADDINLFSALSRVNLNKFENEQLYKCRVLYSNDIEKVEFIPYKKPQIKSLKIIHSNLNYEYKYEDREELSSLYAKRENCDDILIIKDELITDTYFCNILFYNGKNWITPEKPLLKGVQRAYLLKNEKIETAIIKLQDLKNFSKARLINALLEFDNSIEIMVSNIV
ncbi:MAG: hypothetical protein C0598_08620 [Marinilabiliales bacterium]|nr:MAG: hypothetical protein C0598_08620 [Marinilabiliales bacterium]